jgi:hypothetical protein
MKLPKRFYTRRFLNRPGYHSTALVLGEVAVTRSPTKRRPDPRVDIAAEITISDCDRQITLDLNAWGSGDQAWGNLRNAQFKSRTFRKAINDFLDAADAGHALLEQEFLDGKGGSDA